ncbi:EAL domain-containing protein [Robbsia sp. Bb-Pol-6]|uniref:EAL domain-containing protein n=1 Tax=Robbsia betulipollinis TaxID=2981849 RepID=A0ABT3ZJ58_9BURK|nr:EAL domain-containing protein [Robbsia betulipollinis]MCY0386558.1 EAL domain-containing protein [Robbsia betulipollinis]
MRSRLSVRSFFAPRSAELARSQFEAFSRQIPLLYFILSVNTASLAFTHRHVAPRLLAVYLPCLLCALCMVRIISWRRRQRRLTDPEITQRLRASIFMTFFIGSGFTIWSLSLFPYGDAYVRGHVAFYMAFTVIGCIFCLMHLRAAALLLTALVIVPFTAFFAMSGNPVLIAIAVNVLLVSLAMVTILLIYYRDFNSLIESKKSLVDKRDEMQRLSDENFKLANLDSLTLLPNRRRFFADIETLLASSALSGHSFAVGVLDLDGFKQINDLYGHGVGDAVLTETGKRLTGLARPDVAFARLGGDEFGMIIPCARDREGLLQLAEAICHSLALPYIRPKATVRLSGSLGLAIYPDAGSHAEQLLERADYALYFAKQHRRGGTVVFSAEHATQLRKVALVEQELRQADLDSEMSLAFQPIVDTTQRRIVAFEALARWHNPTLGMVDPATFIDIAERCGLINLLTEVLLRKALAFARACPPDIRIAFNLSTLDITSKGALARIIGITQTSGVAPHRIDFEVTETAIINDFDQAREALYALKALGVQISLDDFGTGFSSLSRVHQLPLDKIKIDRSFVTNIEAGQHGRAIVRSIANLCVNLNVACVVEGVETQAQLGILRSLGCDLMQGYFFQRPVSADQALGLLENGIAAFAPAPAESAPAAAESDALA